jgi:hypothetical protein
MTSPYRPGPSRRIPLQNSFANEFCNTYAGLPPAITARHWPLVLALAGLAVEAAVATVCLLLGRAARPGALTKIAETPGGSAHP